MKNIKNILSVSGVYVSAVIGAGFASGQEILSFFVVYGKKSAVGLLIVTALFIFCALSIMLRVYKDGLDGFYSYANTVFGKGFSKVLIFSVAAFGFVGFCAMSASGGEICHLAFGSSRITGCAVIAALCAVMFMAGLDMTVNVSALMAPVMCIGLIYLSLRSVIMRSVTVSTVADGAFNNYIVSAFLYGAYNLLTAIVIMADTGDKIRSKKDAVISSFIGGGILGLMSFIVWLALETYYGKISLSAIPMYDLAVRQGKLTEKIYFVIMLMSTFTTALCCGMGFIGYLKSAFGFKKQTCTVILMLLCIPVIFMGFEVIVSKLYALFGYIGIPVMIAVIFDAFKLIFLKK